MNMDVLACMIFQRSKTCDSKDIMMLGLLLLLGQEILFLVNMAWYKILWFHAVWMARFWCFILENHTLLLCYLKIFLHKPTQHGQKQIRYFDVLMYICSDGWYASIGQSEYKTMHCWCGSQISIPRDRKYWWRSRSIQAWYSKDHICMQCTDCECHSHGLGRYDA